MKDNRPTRVVVSLLCLSLFLFLTHSKPANLWGNKNIVSHEKVTAGGLSGDVQSGSLQLENLINLAGLKNEGPDWRILSQDLGSDRGHIKLSQSKWLMYFLHWRPLTEANKTITVEYVRNHLLNFWGQAMNFKLLNVDGEMEICGHRAVFAEGALTSGAVHTRFIVWNCPQTNRQFTADCNINLQRKTPEDLLDLQRTITRTVCCHKEALPPEVPADLTQKYQSDRWNVSFTIPSTWRTADYVSQEWFPQGMSAQNGSLWTLLTDSVKRLELVWENCEGALSAEVFTRFMEKCAAPFTAENVTSHLDKWDLGNIREKGGIWTGEGTCEYLLKAQNQEAVSRYRSKGFLWKDGPKAYFLLASLIQVREFWNIPNDVSPSDETFERFVAKQIFPNVKIVPITMLKDKSVLQKFNGKEILNHVKVLASEEFKGRETFSDEQLRAARYIAEKFRRYGLKQAGESRDYLQRIEMDFGRVRGSNSLEIGGKAYKEGKEFRVAGVGKGSVERPIVFVGYGVSAKEYDSYAGVDARDKIVMVFEGKINKKGKEYGVSPFHEVLVINAINHGAVGMIFVEGTSPKNRKMPIPSGFAADSRKQILALAQETGLISLGEAVGRKWNEFPLVYVTADVADDVLAKEGKTIAGLKKEIDETGKPRSFALEQTAQIQADVSHGLRQAMNIVGMVEGRDPALKEDFVIIGAHYDHLGMIKADDIEAIAYGADDNASGTGALLEIARVLAESGEKPKRSILFIAFTGEEVGALGSQHYVDHPVVPLEKTTSMLNLDMIGRNDPNKIRIFCSDADLWAISDETSRDLGLTLDKLDEEYSGSSDHAVFFEKKIPVVFYYDGGGDFAHTAKDTWDQLSPEKLEKVARLCFLTAWKIADN